MNGKIVTDEEKCNLDENRNDKEGSMEIIQEVAESIDDIVKFTVDLSSKHDNGKIAVLDVEVNVIKDQQNRMDLNSMRSHQKTRELFWRTQHCHQNRKVQF